MAVSTVTSNINYADPRYRTRAAGAFGRPAPAQQAPPFLMPPQQPAMPQPPQQPAAPEAPAEGQPSSLVSYLEDYRGQKNFFSGRSDAEAAARKQSALSQQLGNQAPQTPQTPQAAAKPAGPPDSVRGDWTAFTDWRKQQDPSWISRYLQQSQRTHQAAGSPAAFHPASQQWRQGMNQWLFDDAKAAGYTGAMPDFTKGFYA
jgi:hypothetical protein